MASIRSYSTSPPVARQVVAPRPVTTTTTTTTSSVVHPQSSYVPKSYVPQTSYSTYTTTNPVPIVSQVENPLGNGPIVFTPPTWEFTNRAVELQGRASGIPRAVQIPTAPAFTPATKVVSQVGDIRSMNQKHPRAWVTTPVADADAPYKLRPRGFSLSTYESTVGNSTDWDVKSRYLIALRSGPTECPDHILCKSKLFPKEEFTSPYVMYYFDETAPNDILLQNDVIKEDKNHKKGSKGFCGMGGQKSAGDDMSQRTTSSSSRSSSMSSSSDVPSKTASLAQSSRNATMRSSSANRAPVYTARGGTTNTTTTSSSYTSGFPTSKSETTRYSAMYKSGEPCCKSQSKRSIVVSKYHSVQEESYVKSDIVSKNDASMREAYVKANSGTNQSGSGSGSSQSSYSSRTSDTHTVTRSVGASKTQSKTQSYGTTASPAGHKHVCKGCGDSHFCGGYRGHSVEIQSRGVETRTMSSGSSVTSSGTSTYSSSVTTSDRDIGHSTNGVKSRSNRSSTSGAASSSYSSYGNPYAGRVSSYQSSSADGENVPMLMPPTKKDGDRNTTYTMRRLFVDVDDLRIPKNGSGLKMLPTYSVSYRNYPVLCYDVVAPSKYEDFFRVRKCPGFFN